MNLSSCHTFVITVGLIELFVNPLPCPQIDIQILWNLRIGSFVVNITQHSMILLNFCWGELGHEAAFLSDSRQLTLVYGTVDKSVHTYLPTHQSISLFWTVHINLTTSLSISIHSYLSIHVSHFLHIYLSIDWSIDRSILLTLFISIDLSPSVHIYIYPSIYHIFFISIYLSIYQLISRSIYSSQSVQIYRSISVCSYLSINLIFFIFIDLSIHRSIRLSLFISIDLSIYLSLFISIFLSIPLTLLMTIDLFPSVHIYLLIFQNHLNHEHCQFLSKLDFVFVYDVDTWDMNARKATIG